LTDSNHLKKNINADVGYLGNLLFSDSILILGNDNSCSGCHLSIMGFEDTQSISIGDENNGIVGPGRKGPRNQRRSLKVINSALNPNLIWNSRFSTNSGDPLDVSKGVTVPDF